jgi:beta-N-acetylhexosaminidase
MTRGAAVGAALALVLLCAGCTPSPPQPEPSASSAGPVTTPSGMPTPSEQPTISPTDPAWEQALADAQALPVEQAAGQVIMATLATGSHAKATSLVGSSHVGGVILMGGAISSADQVASLNAAIASADASRGWPVIIATDEEGGAVQRLRPALRYVSAFMAAGANADPSQIREYYAALGAQMRELGFTMNLAPDADVTLGLKDPTIRTRSAGVSPHAVADVVNAAWEGFESGGITPVIKHFPGHGSVTADSHVALPVQRRTIAELEDRDLVPFRSAIDAGVSAIMVGHLRVAGWGSLPTSVNPRAYAYLRDEMGFRGLLMTDAMDMDAVADLYGPGGGAVAALSAGADLVLMPSDPAAAIRGIVWAVSSGDLSRDRLDDAAAHVILAAREQAALPAVSVDGRPREFAEGSIVVAARNCASLLGDTFRVTGGTRAQRVALSDDLGAEGLRWASDGTEIALVTGDRGSATADVVVATGGPWGLPASHARVYVASWGDGAEQLHALAKVLSGAIPPRGTWPVSVDLPYGTCS